jgi:hypothetical protein
MAQDKDKPKRVNIGGRSQLQWFNKLATEPIYEGSRRNLQAKIRTTRTDQNGCVVVVGFTDTTRPVLDKKFLAFVRDRLPDAPSRYSPWHISMMLAGILVPKTEPPRYPTKLRQVLAKRTKGFHH